MQYLISIFLGMLPEIIYFTLFLIHTKDLREKKLKLGLLIGLVYVLCITISLYKLLYYVAFIFLVYLVLKLLYKKKAQIIDIFIIMYGSFYLTILSYLVYFAHDMTSYFICYAINRLLLFVPFIFRKHFNKLYKKYCKYWNRNDKINRPIKSITLRNISLILINCIIFFMNIVCIYTFNTTIK